MMNHMSMILLLVFFAGGQEIVKAQGGITEKEPKPGSEIVFVCEHGAALSVIGTAYFNKLAREQHLNLHAFARGITPQPELSVTALKGLAADGIAVETKRPQALSPKDAAHARRIVAFFPVPARYAKTVLVENWADVPWPGASYSVARDAILKHLQELIKELK